MEKTTGKPSLRARRERCGVSRATLALRAGVSLPTAASLEAGAVPRRGTSLQRVEAALDELEHEHIAHLIEQLREFGIEAVSPEEVAA
jgi:predicted transcriptional regulator